MNNGIYQSPATLLKVTGYQRLTTGAGYASPFSKGTFRSASNSGITPPIIIKSDDVGNCLNNYSRDFIKDLRLVSANVAVKTNQRIIGTTIDSSVAIHLYTNPGVTDKINIPLRKGESLSGDFSLIDKGMDSYLKQSGEVSSLRKTYRGISSSTPLKNLKEGEIFSDAGYISTSKSESTALKFTRFMPDSAFMTIIGKSGVDISNVSCKSDEQEVLYPKNTEFRLLIKGDVSGMTFAVLDEGDKDAGHEKNLIDSLLLPK